MSTSVLALDCMTTLAFPQLCTDLNIAKQLAGESYNLPTIEADNLSKKAYKCREKSLAVVPLLFALGAIVCITVILSDIVSGHEVLGEREVECATARLSSVHFCVKQMTSIPMMIKYEIVKCTNDQRKR